MTCREYRRPARMYNPALRSRSPAPGEESRIPAREAGPRAAQRKARDTWRRNGDDAAMACRASRDRRPPPSPIVRQAIQRSPRAQDLHRRRMGILSDVLRDIGHTPFQGSPPLNYIVRRSTDENGCPSRRIKFQQRCIAVGKKRIAQIVTALFPVRIRWKKRGSFDLPRPCEKQLLGQDMR